MKPYKYFATRSFDKLGDSLETYQFHTKAEATKWCKRGMFFRLRRVKDREIVLSNY